MINEAMIFAAGLGSRMKPLTNKTPKPLVKVAGKQLIEYSINMLNDAGINKKIINSYHLSDQVEEYFKFVKNVKVIKENERLETGGGLKNALPEFTSKNVITVNSDIIVKYKKNPVTRLFEVWREGDFDILMLLVRRGDIEGYEGAGDFNIGDNNVLNKDSEKKYVYCGLQIINTSILQFFEKKSFSLSEVFTKCLSEGRLGGIVNDDEVIHVGNLDMLKKSEKLLK